MKIVVISQEIGVGRNMVYSNLCEVLVDSQSMVCVDFDNTETAINEADYCVLVSGPTIDSLDPLKELVISVEALGKAFGVLINKTTEHNNDIHQYCLKNQINILEQLPFDEEFSRSTDLGIVISRENDEYRMKFLTLLNNIYMHMANRMYKMKTDGSSGCGGH